MCIQPRYLKLAMLQKLRAQYARAKPFPHLRLTDIFDVRKLKKIEAALKREPFARAEADLFTFAQSADFKLSKQPVLRRLRDYLRSREFLIWLSYVTGEDLSRVIDVSSFIYGDTDHLLPHDDKLEGRKIAFVLNLSTLTARQGGQLDLFEGNRIAKSYPPVWNSLVIFTVKPGTTLHQVREVLTKKKRITITGWVHGAD